MIANDNETSRWEQLGGLSMNHFFKKVTISTAVAGSFLIASYVLDVEPRIASANVEYNVNQILKVGSRGPEVVQLQTKLKEKNYYTSTVDGIYGPLTRNAVIKFQQDNRLLVDGIAGPQTLSALYKSTSNTSKTSTQTTTILKIGSRGQAVKDLQSQLKSLNYYKSSIDGIYGPLTADAVRAFQRDNGLVVDGIAGPKTLAALKNPVKSASFTAPSKVNGSDIISTAKKYLGVPYVWGGSTPNGFDCSGFIQYVFKQHGISLPRTVSQMWNYGKSVSSLQVGDLVFFNTSGSGVSHAGIYMGNNQFIHAGSSTGVTISSLNNSYWKPRYLGAKRVF